jgi:hypothetical protein
VISVTIGPEEAASAAKPKGMTVENLFVSLRVHQVEDAATFTARKPEISSPRKEMPQLTLTDSQGKMYRQLGVRTSAVKGENRPATVFPVALVDEVFMFEAPQSGSGDQRLEVPAIAWGGASVFRFTIPRTMIRRESPSLARSGGGRGR